MKAIVYRNYGAPDVLHCEDVEKPTPGDDEVLIRIRAAAANPMDYHLMSGAYIIRPMTGLRKPKATCPGADLAGEVEAVGRNVTRFQPGDPVFGGVRRAFAEYVCARENRLALKPVNLTFEQAAAVPVAGLTALQGLRDKGRIQPGQRVLIKGAAGGVGTFAVQIAKSFGAEATGVCSTRNVDLVRSIGADHVIDYTRDDFTRSAQRYDLIFDCVGNRPLSACRRVRPPKIVPKVERLELARVQMPPRAGLRMVGAGEHRPAVRTRPPRRLVLQPHVDALLIGLQLDTRDAPRRRNAQNRLEQLRVLHALLRPRMWNSRAPVLVCVSMTKRALFSGGITLLAVCSAVAQEGQSFDVATIGWWPLLEGMKWWNGLQTRRRVSRPGLPVSFVCSTY